MCLQKKWGCIDHLTNLKLREGCIKKEHITTIFFDLEKAYDATWKFGFIKDLYDLELRGSQPKFIKHFWTGRTFQVRIGSTLSDLKNQEGVPQGSILSTTFFNIKINNIIKELTAPSCYSPYKLGSWQKHFTKIMLILNLIQNWLQ